MRHVAALSLVVLALAGCGSARHAAAPPPPTVAAAVKKPIARAPKLHVGLVGPVTVDTAGLATQRGTLAQVGNAKLVLVSSQTILPAKLAAFARAHPRSHFALVGASTAGEHAPNLVGLVLRDDQAAQLAGFVAGLVAADGGATGSAPRVAWVGPVERPLVGAFARGLHETAPHAVLLRQWSRRIPARCKEAALTAIGRGALVVMAHDGTCADAAIAAAHQQNLPSLRLSQFELPDVAAGFVVRDALSGVYHGNEDIVFGAVSGAIGVRTLDPRIPLATAVRARAAAQELASGVAPSG
jgi:hypothetical protein